MGENYAAEDARDLLSSFKSGIEKKKICFMNMKHEWYVCLYKNIRVEVNFINFASELESVHFDRSCQNKGF